MACNTGVETIINQVILTFKQIEVVSRHYQVQVAGFSAN
jgi:hypothetical protein